MKLDAVDISKTASAASIIYDALRRAIVEGELKDGDPLRQDEIARMFHTSRIPVREAISRLEEQGLVKTQRYKGAVVAGVAPEEVVEIFSFRVLVESAVIEAATPRMTRDDLIFARQCCERFNRAESPSEWVRFNREFHRALYAPSGYAYHLSMIDASYDRIDRYLRAQLSLSGELETAHREHSQILAACEKGDAAEAKRLTGAHIQGVKASLLEQFR